MAHTVVVGKKKFTEVSVKTAYTITLVEFAIADYETGGAKNIELAKRLKMALEEISLFKVPPQDMDALFAKVKQVRFRVKRKDRSGNTSTSIRQGAGEKSNTQTKTPNDALDYLKSFEEKMKFHQRGEEVVRLGDVSAISELAKHKTYTHLFELVEKIAAAGDEAVIEKAKKNVKAAEIPPIWRARVTKAINGEKVQINSTRVAIDRETTAQALERFSD